MAYYRTTISHGTTGTKTVTPGFAPQACRITLGSAFGSTDNVMHMSVGNSNGTSQSYHSIFGDSSGHQTASGTNKIVSHFERSGGIVETVAAHIDNATAPWTATQVKYIVDTANANYQFHVEVWG